MENKCFITLLDCSAILFASSLTVIASGIFTSLLTGFKFSLSSSFDLFSLSFALFKDARLLALVSILSLSALDTVSFCSLFLLVFPLNSLAVSSFNLFVALCSASFLFS